MRRFTWRLYVCMSKRKYVFSAGRACPPSWQPRYWCNCRASDSTVRYQVIGYRWQRNMTRDKGDIRAKAAEHKRSRVPQKQGYWVAKKRESGRNWVIERMYLLIRSSTFSQIQSFDTVNHLPSSLTTSIVSQFSIRWISHFHLTRWILWRRLATQYWRVSLIYRWNAINRT